MNQYMFVIDALFKFSCLQPKKLFSQRVHEAVYLLLLCTALILIGPKSVLVVLLKDWSLHLQKRFYFFIQFVFYVEQWQNCRQYCLNNCVNIETPKKERKKQRTASEFCVFIDRAQNTISAGCLYCSSAMFIKILKCFIFHEQLGCTTILFPLFPLYGKYFLSSMANFSSKYWILI